MPKHTVLLIEDSVTQAKQVQVHLSQHGIDVLIAPDGPEGLQIAADHHPALVLLDINLPTMNGYQVCRRLKRDTSTADIPIIMLTSADNADQMVEGLNAGALDYIAKDDFAGENLLLTLRSLGLVG